MSNRLPSQMLRPLFKLLLITAGYFLLSKLSTLLIPETGWYFSNILPTWPPLGFAVGVLVLCGAQFWPAVFVGELLGALSNHIPFNICLGSAFSMVAASVFAGWILKVLSFDLTFRHLKDIRSFLLAALASGTLSATIGTCFLWLTEGLTPERGVETFALWWSGDVLGITVFAPLLWLRRISDVRKNAGSKTELFLLLTVISLWSHYIFPERSAGFTVFPLLIWAALRFGQRGAIVSIVILTLITMWHTLNGSGPFGHILLPIRGVWIQFYIACCTATTMLLAAFVEAEAQRKGLVESEQKFRDLAGTAPVLIWTSNDEGKLLYVNETYLKFSGRKLSQELGAGWLDCVHHEDRELVVKKIRDEMSQKHGFQLEYRLMNSEGEFRWVVNCGVPRFDHLELFYGYIGSCLDITDRRNAEEAIKNARVAAESANRAKTQFLANMSHEIRTPLTAIVGFAELLAQDSTVDSQKNRYCEIIQANSTILSKLVNDIIDISRVEVGSLHVDSVSFDLQEVIANVIASVELPLKEKQLAFHLHMDPNVPKTIVSDPHRVHQILSNLLGNAMKFTDSGSVSLAVRKDTGVNESSLLSFEVTDTGIGILAEKQEDLFNVFHQLDSSPTRRFGGTGLGLALSKEIAKTLGGDVTLVKSTINGGSTFRATIKLEIPKFIVVHSESTPAMSSSRSFMGHLKDMKILLVEDVELNQLLIQLLLEPTGAVVTTVGDGLSAVDAAQKQAFDLILMDIQMPNMDGLEASRIIRQNGFTRSIIALTAHALSFEHTRCLAAGCNAILTKPVHQKELVETIQQFSSPTVTEFNTAPLS